MFTTKNCNHIALLDFSISEIQKNSANNTNILGINYFYSPPEVDMTAKCNISDKSDIFSLGMYYLIIVILIFFFKVFYMNFLLNKERGEIIYKRVEFKFLI